MNKYPHYLFQLCRQISEQSYVAILTELTFLEWKPCNHIHILYRKLGYCYTERETRKSKGWKQNVHVEVLDALIRIVRKSLLDKGTIEQRLKEGTKRNMCHLVGESTDRRKAFPRWIMLSGSKSSKEAKVANSNWVREVLKGGKNGDLEES